MIEVEAEPLIRVGLIDGAPSIRFTLSGRFTTSQGVPIAPGDYSASLSDNGVWLDGPATLRSPSIKLEPADDASRFTLQRVKIGINFHWERTESQTFAGALALKPAAAGLVVVNEAPLESYLVSVVSSEMSAACPVELLRSHAIISRSWLIAQLSRRDGGVTKAQMRNAPDEIIHWYDREGHSDFDVCADDHCQRYQGITKAFSQNAFDAVGDTRGKVLCYGEAVCDARYSKCCGGVTEIFSTAWEDKDLPYLDSVYDGPGELTGYPLPLTSHCNAGRFIDGRPAAYCNSASEELLSRILPGFDQETRNFYRWEVRYSGSELSELLSSRLGIDCGRIRALEPVERGPSGRIFRLRISGEKRSLVIGKELEIRRALSHSHLYSSAFIVRATKRPGADYADVFRLSGAGWGHGVGLCQIGAAVMADQGRSHDEILSHYFRGARIENFYRPGKPV